ncbi:hypothetical protein L210DRAFT_870821 [Boletus edulis BED1]|uniref:Uncharacterized protein n=1 Tax=Boletus edulis BED1 TaxID=1328754 RepID=A0AAD4C0C8_BOLED|nr:hypothetical protein L210DRAFT_870821 [Boletus edulis BED1]
MFPIFSSFTPLTSIETFHRFAVLKANEALQLQKHFKYEKIHSSAKDVRLLSADEVRVLQLFVDQKDTQRRAYILLVRYLIQHYIHYLWTAPELCSPVRRLDDFFPESMNGFNVPSKLHFHVDFSEDEKLYFGQLKLEIREWLDLVLDWESKREETCQQEGLSDKEMSENFVNDFQVKFPPPHKPSELAINVEFCMKEVEDMIRLLEQWFPPHSGS